MADKYGGRTGPGFGEFQMKMLRLRVGKHTSIP